MSGRPCRPGRSSSSSWPSSPILSPRPSLSVCFLEAAFRATAYVALVRAEVINSRVVAFFRRDVFFTAAFLAIGDSSGDETMCNLSSSRATRLRRMPAKVKGGFIEPMCCSRRTSLERRC